jgi:hypothetical protein
MLPTCYRYEIRESYHTGGLDNAATCSNCGRAIVEVAILRDELGQTHTVGMDCADTLCADYFTKERHKAAFDFAKRLAAKIRKARKTALALTLSVHEYETGGYWMGGGFVLEAKDGDKIVFSENQPKHYLPYIKHLTRQDSTTPQNAKV